jgi:hypothetical protein
MVRLYGPLMSLDASGTVADAVTFAKWKGRNYARQRVIPANPQSPGQTSVRAMMRALSQAWTDLTDGNKATWSDRAKETNISPFNAFCSYNLARWRAFKAPTNQDPATEVGTPPTAPTTTVTAGVRENLLSIADGTTPPDWFWMIHRSTTTGFTPSFSTLVRVVPKTATPTIYIDTGLETGIPYYYRICGTLNTGVKGAMEAEKTGTPG